MLSEHLESYEHDLVAAHWLYCKLIQDETVGSDGPIPLNDEYIQALLSRARARKGQALGVATKRLKAAILLQHLAAMAAGFDLTPTLAVKVSQQLIGRAINRKTLLQQFATPGRTASEKSRDFDPERFQQIKESASYQACQSMLDLAIQSLDEIKERVESRADIAALYEQARAQLSASAKA